VLRKQENYVEKEEVRKSKKRKISQHLELSSVLWDFIEEY
jgi:hypothetical protein